TKHNFGFDWSKTCELISGYYNRKNKKQQKRESEKKERGRRRDPSGKIIRELFTPLSFFQNT
ncbi:MAG TPA: hypothetical protein O0Y08_05065, partial [Methanocorpusculum sp.]|nr:hypothetical protein [Methanocorpusculum sp.]